MGGYMHEEIPPLSAEESKRIWEKACESFETTSSLIEKLNNNPEFKVRRKILWKGKQAPPNHVFICMYMKKQGVNFKAHALIKGNQGLEFEEKVVKQLRQSLREKYNV